MALWVYKTDRDKKTVYKKAYSYRIISVHFMASCSSISLSLYWFLSIRTLAISTLVKRFLCAVGTSLYGQTNLCVTFYFSPVIVNYKHSHKTDINMTYIILIFILDFMLGILKLGPNPVKVNTKSLASSSISVSLNKIKT